MAAKTVYKLMTRGEWEAARAAGVYRGSAHDVRDGFIHFSTARQLGETARKYFTGVPDLVLLAVSVDALECASALEQSPPSPQGERELKSQPSSPGERVQRRPFSPRGEGQDEGGLHLHNLRWEPSRGGELFPHLYADLSLSAVQSVIPIPFAGDGTPLLPGILPS